MSVMFEVRALSVEIAGRMLVQALSLDVRAGELLVVLGPNGAGKSTLLRALAGEITPCSGELRLAGRNIRQWPARDLARHRGVMPQGVQVTFPLTVEEVISLGRPREEWRYREAILADLMALLSISHLRHRLIPGLSGGEQQRVQLARVLAQVWDSPGPVLLLLDECTSALDPAHQQQVFGLLRHLAEQRGFSVLAVAHDLNLAARYGYRLLLMHQGQSVVEGTPREVLTPESLQAVYGLGARILDLEDGHPMVIPLAPEIDTARWRYTPPSNPSCRQAS